MDVSLCCHPQRGGVGVNSTVQPLFHSIPQEGPIERGVAVTDKKQLHTEEEKKLKYFTHSTSLEELMAQYWTERGERVLWLGRQE